MAGKNDVAIHYLEDLSFPENLFYSAVLMATHLLQCHLRSEQAGSFDVGGQLYLDRISECEEAIRPTIWKKRNAFLLTHYTATEFALLFELLNYSLLAIVARLLLTE
jgi:hypothetical protein